jgi:SAM-dependent methyltransferase
MSMEDRERWNERYRAAPARSNPSVPAGFVPVVDLLPSRGAALDLACGAGSGAVWLAGIGLEVQAVDASDVAIDAAARLADESGVGDRCRFSVHDLDTGLPAGPSVDLITCHLFSAPGLDREIIGRLRPGGVLAITVLSEVGGEPGPYRALPGELPERFGVLDIRFHREGDGTATLVGAATGPAPTTRLD